MRFNKYIVFVWAALFMVACGVQKQTTGSGKPASTVSKPTWHTCVISGAKAVVTTSGQRVSATVTMQTVRDSLIIMSIMPALGIEMARLEATPTDITAFEKIHNRYVQTTYAELNKRLKPKISWKQLQMICSAELPSGAEKAQLEYSIGEDKIQVEINYTPRKLNLPLKMNRLNTARYKKMDISKWL